jgi:hypothetical protein
MLKSLSALTKTNWYKTIQAGKALYLSVDIVSIDRERLDPL